MSGNHPITIWLSRKNKVILIIYISSIAFLAYTCMYGIRKPFTVASFSGLSFGGIDLKVLLVISQVVGYAFSKFIGIKVISEMRSSSRAISIIILTGIAESALMLFSIVPTPLKLFLLFINGLMLGMIWGVVFAYLEGRKTTEVMGTILSISLIVSSGIVKSISVILMNRFNLTDFQMPWITGLVFFIFLIILVWLLDKTPEPSFEDESLRTKRIPLNKAQRKKILIEFTPGLLLLTISYIILTIFRDLRDNFTVEIWTSIGVTNNSMIFIWSELPIIFIIFFTMSSIMLIKNNLKALQINICIIISGFLLIGFSTLALNSGIIQPVTWMILLGLGTYLGYLPFNCLLFDRMIAAFGSASNAGFFIYLVNSFGYLGSVGTLLFKNIYNFKLSWFNFLISISYGLAIFGTSLMVLSFLYFKHKIMKQIQSI